MASIFNHRIFSNYQSEEEQAVNFLKHLDGPAYVHCYLGKHRVVRVRDALRKAGVPASYWTPTVSKQQYWELVNRLEDARKEFQKKNYASVISILEPVKAKDVDIANLRGWSHYRMGLITEAARDFKEGLEVAPQNPRNLEGLGYCYLREGNPVMAQRAFNLVLSQEPRDQGALVGQGLAFLALGDKPAAARMFRQVLAMNPGNKEAKNYLKRAQTE